MLFISRLGLGLGLRSTLLCLVGYWLCTRTHVLLSVVIVTLS